MLWCSENDAEPYTFSVRDIQKYSFVLKMLSNLLYEIN
jgi:hypothetical protein